MVFNATFNNISVILLQYYIYIALKETQNSGDSVSFICKEY